MRVNKIDCRASERQAQYSRQQFVDWMKAVGMFLIVFGHVVGEPFNQFSVPVYPKQLGVALFMFIMGWGLANEKRPPLQEAFCRLFPVYLWGISAAVILSGIMLVVKNDLNLSNYMPFVLGINAFFNFFPANPTTWYIGTYFHFIFLWFILFRRVQVNARTLAASLFFEVICRTVLICIGKYYVAYMLVPNWITLFLLGMYSRHKRDVQSPAGIVPLVGVWLCGIVIWALAGKGLQFDHSFPFRLSARLHFPVNQLIVSLSVSLVYLFNTFMIFEIFRRVRADAVTEFFSRNTINIFIWHMPLLYGLHPWLYSVIPSVWLQKSVIIVIMFVGLAVISELFSLLIKPKVLRDQLWGLYTKRLLPLLSRRENRIPAS
jgi:hypothetical protein